MASKSTALLDLLVLLHALAPDTRPKQEGGQVSNTKSLIRDWFVLLSWQVDLQPDFAETDTTATNTVDAVETLDGVSFSF